MLLTRAGADRTLLDKVCVTTHTHTQSHTYTQAGHTCDYYHTHASAAADQRREMLAYSTRSVQSQQTVLTSAKLVRPRPAKLHIGASAESWLFCFVLILLNDIVG
jgi:hypothetical protein